MHPSSAKDATSSPAPIKSVKPPALSPRDYFDIVLPNLLRWKGEAATSLGVAVRFDVTGRGGGQWTILLRPPKAGVVEGTEWKPDLTIRITSGELLNMLRGQFDARKALGEGNVTLEGDLAVLKRVGFLFQAGGNPREMLVKKKRASNR